MKTFFLFMVILLKSTSSWGDRCNPRVEDLIRKGYQVRNHEPESQHHVFCEGLLSFAPFSRRME